MNNKDRYVGEIDSTTKLRHGQGCYTYSNPHFQFQGNWIDGIKDKQGTLIMRGSGFYSGEFVNGEINGKGTRTYDDGTTYVGGFVMGEKNGFGEIVYG